MTTPTANLSMPAQNPPAPKATRVVNAELQVMAKIDKLLAELDDEAAGRVLAWTNSRHSTKFLPSIFRAALREVEPPNANPQS